LTVGRGTRAAKAQTGVCTLALYQWEQPYSGATKVSGQDINLL